jgi:hypothetical protein
VAAAVFLKGYKKAIGLADATMARNLDLSLNGRHEILNFGVSGGFSWRDGTTHMLLEPIELVPKLAALVPPQRLDLVRYNGFLRPRHVGDLMWRHSIRRHPVLFIMPVVAEKSRQLIGAATNPTYGITVGLS